MSVRKCGLTCLPMHCSVRSGHRDWCEGLESEGVLTLLLPTCSENKTKQNDGEPKSRCWYCGRVGMRPGKDTGAWGHTWTQSRAQVTAGELNPLNRSLSSRRFLVYALLARSHSTRSRAFAASSEGGWLNDSCIFRRCWASKDARRALCAKTSSIVKFWGED